ncbi:MAG: histidinol dehydrogenase [Gammaproteobacteria bacterium]|nr:MAG: histidinol dehydrogenase [Gammaproteobacteria bacterium]
MLRLDARQGDFWQRLEARLRFEASREEVFEQVRAILREVRRKGDAALLSFARRFDGLEAEAAEELLVPPRRLEEALAAIPQALRRALEEAASRIRDYHERQKAESWTYEDELGNLLGQQVIPLERVGIYVPGGKAAYPSSVLMNAIPAKVAGVGEIVMVSPRPDELVLAAAAIAGVDRVFTVGGAHGVAALAYGTETLPRVDKIVGPGNIYVATAKQLVFGTVGIDMIAGPSEILVISDGTAPADGIAMDRFSQASHNEEARSLLISPGKGHLDEVEAAMARLLPTLERRAVIEASLARHGALIEVQDLEQAVEVANFVAPEHLELAVAEPERLLPSIRHAGAVFLGPYTPEALGDYCAGPNHVLPTAGTARFSSPLGVYDFQKRTSLIRCSREGAAELAAIASILARGEGLTAHARSAEYREDERDP